MTETITSIESVPRHRPDLEAVYWQEGDLRQFHWYTWPYTCPACGFTGELVCGVVRRVRDATGFTRPITEAERADSFAKQRAEFERNAANLCPRCLKRARDRGMTREAAADG